MIFRLTLSLAVLASGCSSKSTIDCQTNADCLQGGIGGFCHHSSASEQSWCAFPDPGCPGTGQRWGVASGDGLAGNCVASIAQDGGVADGGPVDASEPTDFAFRFGGVTDETLLKAVPASDGTLFVVAWFEGSVTIGGMRLTSAGMGDFLVARLRTNGDILWMKRFGGLGNERPIDLAAGLDDSVMVAGTFTDTTDLGGGEESARGVTDFFVLKLDSAGDFVWARPYGWSGEETPTGVAVNSAGDIFVTGYFNDFTDLGDGIQQSAGSHDLFLARYAGLDGEALWSERIGSTGDEWSAGISTAGPNVAISGNGNGSVNLGGGEKALPKGGAFVASYSAATGIYGWARVIEQPSLLTPVYVNALALLSDGSLGACASLSADTDFGGGVLHRETAFFGHYRVGGSLDWQRPLGSSGGGVSCRALAVSKGGHLLIAGEFGGVVDFGANELASTENNRGDVFLAEYAPDNQPVKAMRFGGPGDELVSSLTAVPEAILMGHFTGMFNLENGDVLSSAGGRDSFVIGRVLP